MIARRDDPWGGRSSTAAREALDMIEGGLDGDANLEGPDEAGGGSEGGALDGEDAAERALLVDFASADGSKPWASVTDILRRFRGPSELTDGFSIENPRLPKTLRTALRRLDLFEPGVWGAEWVGETSSVTVWGVSSGLSTMASGDE